MHDPTIKGLFENDNSGNILATAFATCYWMEAKAYTLGLEY